MGKHAKRIIAIVLVIIMMVAFALAGDYFNILSKLGSSSHTADEVLTVKSNNNDTLELQQENVPYTLEVEIGPVLLQEAQQEKKLIIMTQKASASQIAKKGGLFGIPIFKQTKAIVFYGEGTFFVDLSSLTSDDFVIDKEEKTITIYIPKPQFTVKLLPNETEFFDSSNGMLRFGEMEITPEYMSKLESEGIERISQTLSSDSNTLATAEKFAKLSVKELFEPLVKAQIDAALENAEDDFAIPPQYTIIVEIKQ